MGKLEPRLMKGAPPSLFERFVVDAVPPKPETVQRGVMDVSKHCIPVSELRQSVAKEVGWLLNTRYPIDSLPLSAPRSVVNYGIPDLSSFTAHNPDHLQDLGVQLEQVIEAFEPRLRQVHVQVSNGVGHGQGLCATVEAHLVVGHVMQPVVFQINLQEAQMEGIYERAG